MSARDRRRTEPVAPRATWTRRPYADLLAAAGFADVDRRDVTAAYRATVLAWLTASRPVLDELAAVDGASAVDERLAKWEAAIGLIDDGLLLRARYSATRP